MARASKPKDRVALALAVNVGSLVEEESERGVAHILEHLAFNATEVCSTNAVLSCTDDKQKALGHACLFTARPKSPSESSFDSSNTLRLSIPCLLPEL